MGVYLSSPVTEKISDDKKCSRFTYGVSSMQGWRMTQEDAHNCISDFDNETNTSLFAVYDGHGGAEVAQYTSAHLPDFIKTLPQFKEGELADLLQEAFLGFDKKLTEESVIQELKLLAGVEDDENEEAEDEEGMGRSERDMLVAEANMPIEELMAKYSAPLPQLKKVQKEKYPSPMIKAKKASVTAKGDSSSNNSSDPLASRLEEKLENGQPDNDNNLNVEKELREAETQETAKTDSSNKIELDNASNAKTENINSSNSVKTEIVSNGENGHLAVSDDKSVLEKENSGNCTDSEPDSTSDKVCETKNKSEESVVTDTEVSSSSSSKIERPSSSGQSIQDAGCSSSSGLGSLSADASEASLATGSGAGGSGSNTESVDGPSGSGTQAGGSGQSTAKKSDLMLEEDYDSEDESSDEDEEYMEDSDEEDDEDEEEDEEEDSLQGGIFGVRTVNMDEEEDHIEEPGTDSGCTAVVALLRNDKLYVANAGDSRCVLCQDSKAVDLSVDHKPEDECERTRIEAAGGKVTCDGRVNGGLNLSRALGDHWYKRNETKEAQDQMITALPDVECATITDDVEFMVIACDGIWNFMTSQETVDFIKERLKDPVKYEKPSLICEELFDFCLAPNTMGDGTGCDNMTCIIVVFNKSQSSSKRDIDSIDTSATEDKQPEKRAKLDGDEAKPVDT